MVGGHVEATSGVKGIGDLFGKAIKGVVTKETAVKPDMWEKAVWYWNRRISILFWWIWQKGCNRHDHRGWYVSCL